MPRFPCLYDQGMEFITSCIRSFALYVLPRWIQSTAIPVVLTLLTAILVTMGCKVNSFEPDEVFGGEIFWQQSDVPNSGYIGSLVGHPSGMLFAGTQSAGVYRSTDDGLTWSPSGIGITASFIRSMAVTPSGVILAGTDTAGVFRSTDAGSSWKNSEGLAEGLILSFVVDRQNRLFATKAFVGVFKSMDDGATWALVDSQYPISTFHKLAVDSLGVLWATSDPGDLYRSTDSGTSWAVVTVGDVYVTAIFAGRNGEVYAGSGLGKIFRSKDNGGSWLGVSIASTSVTCSEENSLGHLFVGTGGDGVYRSTNNGDSWAVLGRGVSGKSDRLGALHISSIMNTSTGYLLVGDYERILRSIQPTIP